MTARACAVLLLAALASIPAPSIAAGRDAAGAQEKPRGPGVPVRKDPFAPNTEIRRILESIPDPERHRPRAVLSPSHPVYDELSAARPAPAAVRPADDSPLVLPIRLLGLVEGAQLSAILRVGSGPYTQLIRAVPGTVVEHGRFAGRVTRIEAGRVVIRTLDSGWELAVEMGSFPGR